MLSPGWNGKFLLWTNFPCYNGLFIKQHALYASVLHKTNGLLLPCLCVHVCECLCVFFVVSMQWQDRYQRCPIWWDLWWPTAEGVTGMQPLLMKAIHRLTLTFRIPHWPCTASHLPHAPLPEMVLISQLTVAAAVHRALQPRLQHW